MGVVRCTVQKLLLAAPRGYCAGVDRAVQTVERALALYGPPVYVRKEIVHNKHVVEDLREKGAIFVEEETEIPRGANTVFSAHGVAPSVRARSPAWRTASPAVSEPSVPTLGTSTTSELAGTWAAAPLTEVVIKALRSRGPTEYSISCAILSHRSRARSWASAKA